MFEHIIGNQQAKDYLLRMVERRRIGNSLLFAGIEGIGKSLFAESFAKLILCQDDPKGLHKHKIEAGSHPDLHQYKPEGKIGLHSIASMRQFCEEVYMAPFEAPWKVFIIYDADRMLPSSANALLKTFEEPAKDAIIILHSSSPALLLPTVLSRCRTIYFHPIPTNAIENFLCQQGKSSSEASAIAAMAQGSIGKALRLMDEGNNPLRRLVLHFLASSNITHYKQLSEIANSITEQMEESKKQVEEEVRSGIVSAFIEAPSAAQKQSIEKEVEGALSLFVKQEAGALLESILAWYRDMHLMLVNGNRQLLLHPDYSQFCEESLENGKIRPLAQVEKAVSETMLMLERSTSLNICFENLFLKLNLLT